MNIMQTVPWRNLNAIPLIDHVIAFSILSFGLCQTKMYLQTAVVSDQGLQNHKTLYRINEQQKAWKTSRHKTSKQRRFNVDSTS